MSGDDLNRSRDLFAEEEEEQQQTENTHQDSQTMDDSLDLKWNENYDDSQKIFTQKNFKAAIKRDMALETLDSEDEDLPSDEEESRNKPGRSHGQPEVNILEEFSSQDGTPHYESDVPHKQAEKQKDSETEVSYTGEDNIIGSLVKQIMEKQEKKGKIKEDLRKLESQFEEAKRNKDIKNKRMSSKKEKLDKQIAKLSQQTEELKADAKSDGNAEVNTTKLDEEIEKIGKLVKDMKKNASRLVAGKGGHIEKFKLGTLDKMQSSDKMITIFSGRMEEQPEVFKEEMAKMKKINMVTCDESLKKIVAAVKSHEVKERDGTVGVFLLKWIEGKEMEDTAILMNKAEKFAKMVKLLIQKGKDKFEFNVVVLPPATTKTVRQVKLLGQEVDKLKEDKVEIIKMMDIQCDLGEELKNEVDKVWRKGEQVFAVNIGEGEEDGSSLKAYTFRRCLTELSKSLMEREGGEVMTICRECGMEHEEELCLLKKKPNSTRKQSMEDISGEDDQKEPWNC